MLFEFFLDLSSMSRWRKRIGVKGAEAILKATVKAAELTGIVKPISFRRVIADTTVTEKKHHLSPRYFSAPKAFTSRVAYRKKQGFELRQTYIRVGKRHAYSTHGMLMLVK